MTQMSQEIVGNDVFWDYHRTTTMGRYLFDREYAFVEEHADSLPAHAKLIDVCCGPGYFTTNLRKKGKQIFGFDFSATALEMFQNNSAEVPLALADAMKLPVSAECVDGVIATQCLIYLDHDIFFAEAARALRPGGLLIFDAVNHFSYKGIAKLYVRRASQLPRNMLKYADIVHSLKNCGFAVKQVRGYNWPPFLRESNHKMVHITAMIEKGLRLESLYKVSPKILVAAQKL